MTDAQASSQTRVHLLHIEIKNFKSYKGRTKIDFTQNYIAIVGSNGSGKSNLLDALSFVMGQKTINLRQSNLGNLVYGAIWQNPTPESVYVEACLQIDNEPKVFKRMIDRNRNIFEIDQQVVREHKYLEELRKLGIYTNIENFLIRQGTVTDIAIQNATELTATFEAFSGSSMLKEEYENLLNEKTLLETKLKEFFRDISALRKEKKHCNEKMKEANKFLELEKLIHQKQFQKKLFELFMMEKIVSKLKESISRNNNFIEETEKEKQPKIARANSVRKTLSKLNDDLRKMEQETIKLNVDIRKRKGPYAQIFEHTLALNDKLRISKRTLDKALKERKSFENEILNLEENIEIFKRNIEDSENSHSSIISFEESQLQEYYDLKNECDKKTANLGQDLVVLERQFMSTEDQKTRLLYRKNKINTDITQLKLKLKELENSNTNFKIDEKIRQLENELLVCDEKHLEYCNLLEYEEACNKEIQNLQELLQDIECNKDEHSQTIQKREILEKLKSKFDGVHGRLIDLCQPVHPKYNVAVTKIFKNNIDAIIVDTMDTAIKCTEVLKQKLLGREKFLPLDSIVVKPIQEHLRNMADFRGVCMINDVVNCENYFRPVVRHVTKNTLVCETAEIADQVSKFKHVDAVSLNGTLYQKSGLISGGEFDLLRKSKKWDEKVLQNTKSDLKSKSKDLLNTKKKLNDLYQYRDVEKMREGNEVKLRMMNQGKLESIKLQNAMKDNIIRLNTQLQTIESEIVSAVNTINNYDGEISDIKTKIKEIVDNIFKNFCEKVGIDNIQDHERGGLKEQQERAQKKLDNKAEIQRLVINLEYRKEQDRTADIVKRWEDTVERDMNELEIRKLEEQNLRTELSQVEKNLEQVENKIKEKKEEIQTCKSQLVEAENEVKEINNCTLNLQARIEKYKNEILKHNYEHESILRECKFNGIKIPFKNEELNSTESSIDQGDSIQDQLENSSILEREGKSIDYDKLPRSLRSTEINSFAEIREKLDEEITLLNGKSEKLTYRNLSDIEKLRENDIKLANNRKIMNEMRKDLKTVTMKFENVKKERYKKFMECFDQVGKSIDDVYKKLSNNNSAQASITIENIIEPYLGGVIFSCIPPNKSFMLMNNLSGGEKSIASLALLFAMRMYKPAPFFLLDEVDCTLDTSNVGLVRNYFNLLKTDVQIIIVSLNPKFFKSADKYLGVFPEISEEMCSRVVSLDTADYIE